MAFWLPAGFTGGIYREDDIMRTSNLDAVVKGLEEITNLLVMSNLVMANGGNIDIDEAIIMANNGVDIHDSLPDFIPSEYLGSCSEFLGAFNRFKTLI